MTVQVVFRDGGEVDGAGGGCFVGVVCHAASKVELDEVGVEDEPNNAKVNIAGLEGEFTVAGVNGTLKDEVDVKETKEGTTPHARYTCNGLADKHVRHKHTSLSFTSAVWDWASEAQPKGDSLCAYCVE